MALGITQQVFVAAFAGSALLGLVLTPAVRRAALAFGVLDIPDARKVHTAPVPRLGGVAVGLAMALAVLTVLVASPALRSAVFGTNGLVRWGALGAAALAVLVVGAADDVRGLPAGVKLALEVAAAGLVVSITGVPDAVVIMPSGHAIALGALAPALAALWIVTLTNAVNMTDVMDGVASGVGAICAGALGLTSLALGHVVPTVVLLGLAGALAGFLPYNVGAPRIFLGDSGSLLIGFVVGAASLPGLEQGGAWLAWPALLAVDVPLAECGLTVTRRLLRALAVVRPGSASERFLLRRGRAGLFVPDRRHLPHRLRELGLTPRVALALLYGAAGAGGTLAVAAEHWPVVGPPAVLLALAGVLYLAPRWLYEELRLLDRGAFLPLLETRVVHNRAIHVLYDAAAVAFAFLVSRALTGGSLPGDAPLWSVTGVVMATTVAGFRIAGLYRGSYRQAGLAEAARAVRAVIVGGVLGGGAAVALLGRLLPPALWVSYLYVLLTLVAGARFSFRILEYVYQRAQLGGRRAVIFGADRAGRQALAEMLAQPQLGLRPVCFVDDDPRADGADFQGYPVRAVGGDALARMLQQLDVSDVIVPAGTLPPARLDALGALCRALGVRLLHFAVRWDAAEERALARVPQASVSS